MSAFETASPALTLTLFGPLVVYVQGVPLPPVRSRKALWLLVLLTLRHDRPVEREWLAGTLWPDMDQSQAFSNLRPVLSELRRALQSEGTRLQTPDRHTLLLDLHGTSVDVLAFDTASTSKKLSDLERAVALYSGPLLEGCNEEWVFQERAAREQSCLHALQTLAEAAMSAGDYATAAGYYRRAVVLDPWGDSVRRGWMEALAKGGDRNAALQVYRDYIQVLKSDPKAIPDEKTSALYVRLRAEARQQAHPQTAAPVQATPPSRVTGYLPHTLTELVGREDERMEVATRLRRSRLVTLTGLGGIGKTRLAMQVAAESVQEYADGVWLVALESLSEGKLVVPQIASVLGLREEVGRPLLQTVSDALRQKRLLLVLDNCEHLRVAAAQVAGHLLKTCAQVRILATSREALGITGETAWTVPSLATPDPQHLPQGRATLLRVLMGYESVQLFVDRAQAVQQTFHLTSSNALAVAQICFQLEGIPLAIELAAARVKAMTVEQMAERLHDHLGLLTGGSRVALSRQQTLRATLDWSYALLSEPEQQILRRLSIFVGGWSLEAAEAVCAEAGLDTWQILNLLTALVDRSLVAYEERDSETGGRYRLLEMVRQYALERLKASGEAESLGGRHYDWFLALAQEAERQLPRAESGRWLRRLEIEYNNLRAALAYCETQAAENGLRLASALVRFWFLRGDYNEGLKMLEQALAKEPAPEDAALRAKALNGAGAMAYYQGDYAAAQALYEESLRLRREMGDQRGVAESLNNLGNVAHSQGDYERVQTNYQETLQIFTELGDRRSVAWSLNGLGNIAKVRGDYAAAQALQTESLKINRELGDKHGIATSLNSLADVLQMREDYVSVRELCEESLRLFQELGDRNGTGWSLYSLGNLTYRQEEYAEAHALFEECLSLRRQSGDRYSLAWVLHSLGKSARAQGDYAAAHTYFEESLRVFKELGDRHGIGWALHGLGRLAAFQSDFAAARTQYLESVKLFRELKDKVGQMEFLRVWAEMLGTQDLEMQKSVRLWSVAEALRLSLELPLTKWEQRADDAKRQQARQVLGEDVFLSAWEEGLALPWEQAIDDALTEA